MLRLGSHVAVVALLTTSLVGGLSAPATADPAAQIINIPSSIRAHPRIVSLIGQSSEGVLYASEQDPTGQTSLSQGALAGHLEGTDGSNSDIDGTSDRMLGNREVAYTPDAAIGDLRSRVLPDLTWVDTVTPTGWNYLGDTAAGMLVDKVYTDTVEEIPWGGGTPIPVTGLPATDGVEAVGASDASGILLGVESAGATTATYYFDGATHRAVRVNVPWTTTLALGNTELAWRGTSHGKAVIDTMTRPTISHPTTTIHTRPAVRGIVLETLLPIGNTVVVFHGNEYGFFDFTAATSAPVYAVGATGKIMKLLAWGHDVTADGSSILLVGGSTAVNESIDRINPATGAKTTVVAIPTVESHVKEIAVDGDTVYTTNDSAESGAVVQHQVTFGSEASAGAAKVIATGADISPTAACGLVDSNDCSGIQTGDGTTVWQDPGVGERVRASTGIITTSPVASQTGEVSDNWALTDSDSEVATLSNGATHSFNNVSYPLDLDDGIVYLTGLEAGEPATDIVARDLATGTDTLLTGDAPDCQAINSLHSAGNWLVMSCVVSGSRALVWRVVDQTGATAPWEFPDDNRTLWIGDGFMARVGDDDSLQWAPLAASSPSWATLDTVADDGGSISVSRGSTPTIGWVDSSRQAHIAQLPIANVATGELAKIAARWNPTTTTVDVSWVWAAPDPASFTLGIGGSSAPSQTVDGDVRSVSIPIDSFTAGTTVSFTAADSPTTWAATATIPDSVAPTPALAAVPATTTTATFTVTPIATDNVGVLSVDVREKSAAWNEPLSAWTQPAALQGIDNNTAFRISDLPGSTYCFSTRARDVAGNVSAWTAAECTDVLRPVTALSRTGAWTAIFNSNGSGVLAYESASTSAHLTTTTRGHSVSLLVYDGPTAGTLVVTWKGTRFTDSLESSTPSYQLIEIPVPATATAISISPAAGGKPIIVQGIVETAY